MLQKKENHLEDSRQKLRSKTKIALKSLLQQFHINSNTDSNVYSENRKIFVLILSIQTKKHFENLQMKNQKSMIGFLNIPPNISTLAI